MLKNIGIFISTLILIAITLVVLLIVKPEWYFSEEAFEKITTTFMPEGSTLTWDDYHLETSFEGDKKVVNIKMKGMCYKSKDLTLRRLCFKKTHVEAKFGLHILDALDNIKITKLLLTGGEGKLVEVNDKDNDDEKTINLGELNSSIVSPLSLVQKFLVGSVIISIDQLNAYEKMIFTASVNEFDNIKVSYKGIKDKNFKGGVSGSLIFEESKTLLKIKADGALERSEKYALDIEKELSEDISLLQKLNGNVYYKGLDKEIRFLLHGHSNELKVKKIYFEQKNELSVSAPLCGVLLNQDDLISSLKISCDEFTSTYDSSNELGKALKLNGRLRAKLDDVEFGDQSNSAELDVEVEASLNEMSEVKIIIKDELVISSEVKKYPYIHVNLSAKNIHDFYPYLKKFSLVPPAPFYSLQGKVDLELENENDREKIDFSLKTDLKSKNQKMVLKTEGTFDVNKYLLNMKVELDDTKIVAPDINLIKKLTIAPSDKIYKSRKSKEKKKKKKESEKLTFDISIKSISPVLVANSVTEKPIPLNIDLKLNNELFGSLNIKDYNLELFRRSALVKHAKLKLLKNGNEEIDAKIKVNHARYEITISIVGPTKGPSVILESEPFLSRDNIISVLLYGETIDGGNITQASSVANTSMALSDKLMGAASLFLFASTPINSVRYDSESESVKASFNLGSSTTLTVASAGSDNRSDYGLQKSLGNNLYFDTELINDKNEGESYVVGLLKWIVRY